MHIHFCYWIGMVVPFSVLNQVKKMYHLYLSSKVFVMTTGLITLAVSGTGTVTGTETWMNGLYGFM